MKRLLLVLLALPSYAALTTISDTLYQSNGVLMSGKITVSCPAMTGADLRTIPANTVTVSVVAGVVLVDLEPTDTATPSGSYCTAKYSLNNGTKEEHYWLIPTSATSVPITGLNGVQANTAPSTTATFLPSQISGSGVSKGSLLAFGTNWGTLAPGTNDYVLTADSTQTRGVKWAVANVGTATALAANGANCTVGNYPLGVDASGAVESCTALPTNTATATALAANGTNCSAGDYSRGVDASGNAENCTTLPTNTATATALAANGANCSAGSFPLGVDASGASEGCTAATSALGNFTISGSTLTGTGTTKLTSSGGTVQVQSTSGGTLDLIDDLFTLLQLNGGAVGIGPGISGPSGSLEVYHQLGGGVTRSWVREGSGQSTSEVFGVYANDGTTLRWSVINGVSKWGTTAEPTCNSGNRGSVVYVAGGGGVADTFRICGKDAADSYSYKTLATF